MSTESNCTHKEPEEGWVEKHKRKRYVKDKVYVWVHCPGCNVTFMWCETPKPIEKKAE